MTRPRSLSAVVIAVWLALTPAFEKVVGHRYDPFTLPWWAVIAGTALAVLTAIAASWWPARAASRLPIVAALSGETGRVTVMAEGSVLAHGTLDEVKRNEKVIESYLGG